MLKKMSLLIGSLFLINFNVNAVNTEPILKSKGQPKSSKAIGIDFVGKKKAKTNKKTLKSKSNKKKLKRRSMKSRAIITSPDPH